MVYAVSEFSDYPKENEVRLEPMCCITVKKMINMNVLA